MLLKELFRLYSIRTFIEWETWWPEALDEVRLIGWDRPIGSSSERIIVKTQKFYTTAKYGYTHSVHIHAYANYYTSEGCIFLTDSLIQG